MSTGQPGQTIRKTVMKGVPWWRQGEKQLDKVVVYCNES